MRASSILFGAAGATAAVVTGVATYSALGQPTEPVSAEVAEADAPKQQPRVRFLPCEPGARLQGQVCVTRVVRTVEAAAPAGPPVVAPENSVSAVAPAAAGHGSGDDGHHSDDWNDDSDDDSDDDWDDDRDDDDHSGHGSGDDDHDDHDDDHHDDHDDDHDDHDDDDGGDDD